MSRKINILQTKLSNKQKHTLDYWREATNEIENTCLSVLQLLYQNNDYESYLKYQRQFSNFKDIRNILAGIVLKTVETDNLFLMESLVVDAVRQLMNIIAINPSVNQYSTGKRASFQRTVGRLYSEISLIIMECMVILKDKMHDLDEYLSKIPAKQIKREKETLKIVKMLDTFANRLNFLLKMTLKGREQRNEEVAKSVFQSVEMIITSVQRISFATCDKRTNWRIKPPAALNSSTCMSTGGNEKFERCTRNVWSLVREEKRSRFNNTPDTSRCIETILNNNNLRFREKLEAIKQRIKCSTKKVPSQDDSIPYGWIHPTEEQIEEYICKNGGCPTSTLQRKNSSIKNQTINAGQRFTLKELAKIFPIDTQHLRFPPNPSNASIFKMKVQNTSPSNSVDEDLLEGLLWQWHETSDSESTISIRFQFEMSETHRREKWFRGFRRLLKMDPVKTDVLKKEIELVKQSKSYADHRPDSMKNEKTLK